MLANVTINNSYVKSDSISYYLQVSKNYNQKKHYSQALEYAQKAKNYALRNSLKPQIAETYYAVGSILLNQKEYTEALRILQRAVKISAKFNPKIYTLTNYKLGILYSETNDFKNAEKYFTNFEESYNQVKPNISIKNINSIKIDKAILLEKLGKLDLAKSMYSNIISQKRIDHNTIQAYINLSNIIPQDSVSWAINKLLYIDKQYPTINSETKSNIYLSLVNLYLKKRSSDSAAIYLKKFSETQNDQLADNIVLNNINNSIFPANPNNVSISQNSESIKFTKLISIMSIALIAILSLLSLSLYRNNKERMRINRLLQNKNRELELSKDNAEKASKARTEFLSTVSHELRTPLNAITGITHILLEENPKKSQLQYLKSLEFSGDYLLHFINDILEINRIESGNAQIEDINYDIRQLLENIIESFSEISRSNEVQCMLEIDTKIPPLLIGDPTKLSQIFMNLIGNAMKFSKKGKVTVTIKKLQKNDNWVDLLMEVKDTGIGISAEKQASIFDNFTQGSVEINRKYGGTGLGLAIVKSLIELLGGEIKLESKEGVGSKFYFTISQKISTKAEIIPVKINYNNDILKNMHVLVVEDNKINLMITEKMLSKKEMTYESVDNGTDAIRVAKEKTFDLILMDIHLPGINGTVAAQEIRKFNPTIPIIALTAISLNENREALLAYGMDEVITKPFQSDKFYQIIAQTLETKLV